MTTLARSLHTAWAARHRTLLLVLVLTTVLVATVAIAATVAVRRPVVAPAPVPGAPPTSVEQHCDNSSRMLIAAFPVC